jgi:ubiquinone/menaquinone biosynthesis C-methylase UbiE
MTEQVALASRLDNEMMVADLGCGIGGPACYLSKKYGCTLFGISLAEKQIHQATELALLNGLKNRAFFTVGDYASTPYENDSMDVVYAIESSCYAVNKLDFLREAWRILKPGGKMVVLDFFWTGNEKTREHRELMTLWCNSWAIDNYAYARNFYFDCQDSGFRNIEKKDITANVLPSIKKLHTLFYPSLLADGFLRLLGRRRGRHKNMYSALYQYQAHQHGLWQYMIFTATK